MNADPAVAGVDAADRVDDAGQRCDIILVREEDLRRIEPTAADFIEELRPRNPPKAKRVIDRQGLAIIAAIFVHEKEVAIRQ